MLFLSRGSDYSSTEQVPLSSHNANIGEHTRKRSSFPSPLFLLDAGLHITGNPVAAPAAPHPRPYIMAPAYHGPGYPSPPRGPLGPMVPFPAGATVGLVPGGPGALMGAQPVLAGHPGAYMAPQPLPPMQSQQQMHAPQQQMHAQHQPPTYFVGPSGVRQDPSGRQQQQQPFRYQQAQQPNQEWVQVGDIELLYLTRN